nr:hypothetical protein [Eubacterium sp.]
MMPESVTLTTDLAEVVQADIVLISIGSQQLHGVAQQLGEMQVKNKKIVLCMKGMEIATDRRLSQVVDDAVDYSNKVAVWLGPGHIQEFYRGIANCMVIDSKDEFVKHGLIQTFSSSLIRFYYGTDMIGNEIGAAAKNVIGIAAGMLDGLDMATLKGALMARGTREIEKLIAAMEGKEHSVYGILYEEKDAKSELEQLFERSLKNEF